MTYFTLIKKDGIKHIYCEKALNILNGRTITTLITSKKNRKKRSIVRIEKKAFYVSRLLTNAKKGEYVDHINGNPLDNRLCNLRICTNQQNAMNQKPHKDRLLKFKGVVLCKKNTNKFNAGISPNGKRIHLGYFSTPEAAAKAYDEAAIKYFGDFALTNAMLGLIKETI